MSYRSYKGFDKEEFKPAFRAYEDTASLYPVVIDHFKGEHLGKQYRDFREIMSVDEMLLNHFKGDTITMDKPVKEAYKYNLTPNEVIEVLKELTDEQRKNIFDEFCYDCGNIDSNCYCWEKLTG